MLPSPSLPAQHVQQDYTWQGGMPLAAQPPPQQRGYAPQPYAAQQWKEVPTYGSYAAPWGHENQQPGASSGYPYHHKVHTAAF